MSRIVTILAATSLALGASACSKKAPETLPPAPGEPVSSTDSSPQGAVPGSQADFARQMAGQDVIYFDTDRFDIDSTDAAALQSQARWLLQYREKRATIEGHADERGTREYNLALGERRANAAKNYLVSIGVEAARLSVVSYGKERPVALASNEEAWARNRRAATITID